MIPYLALGMDTALALLYLSLSAPKNYRLVFLIFNFI
jgi:hypothetical protein